MTDVTPIPKQGKNRPNPRTRAREKRRREAVRLAVFERDHWTCQLAEYSPCFGYLTPHHIRKAGQGGTYTEDNIIAACSYHNDELEADAEFAAWARARGFVKRREDQR